jgi:hypothetical protein
MLDNADKQFFVASVLVPLLLWWYFTGRKKYGAKGMR